MIARYFIDVFLKVESIWKNIGKRDFCFIFEEQLEINDYIWSLPSSLLSSPYLGSLAKLALSLTLYFTFLIELLDTTLFSLYTAQRESPLNFLISYLHNRLVHLQSYNL